MQNKHIYHAVSLNPMFACFPGIHNIMPEQLDQFHTRRSVLEALD